MKLEDWMKEYKKICRELGILPKDDYEARDTAARIMGDKEQPLTKLEGLIKNREVIICGAGPSLEKDFEEADRENKTIIGVDGATSFLLESGVYPDIVVTDLDGDTKDLLLADRFGAVMVVHAHGDNTGRLKKLLPRFKRAVATTQVEPLPNVRNFCGFTDGDRAVFIARHFGARNITLLGFDYGDSVGPYSDPSEPRTHEASETKKKKLAIAERLVKKALAD